MKPRTTTRPSPARHTRRIGLRVPLLCSAEELETLQIACIELSFSHRWSDRAVHACELSARLGRELVTLRQAERMAGTTRRRGRS